MLNILDIDTGEVIATHKIHEGKGNLIQIHHPERVKGKNIQELEQKALAHFEHSDEAIHFLHLIEEAKPRYYRDQLHLINQVNKDRSLEDKLEALKYCMDRALIGASFYKEALEYILMKKEEATSNNLPFKMPELNSKPNISYIKPETRKIEEYLFYPRKDSEKWVH